MTAAGLFVEHYEKTQVVWNGNRGRTIFYESEAPYDPPSQAAWMNGANNGYPSYMVATGVRSHSGTGLIVWTLFFNGPIHMSSAVKSPKSKDVTFADTTGGVIAIGGGIQNVINDDGQSADATNPISVATGLTAITKVASYPPANRPR